MYQNFIGIDIGKSDFFVSVYGEPKVLSYRNDQSGFDNFFADHSLQLERGLVVLETTGGYELDLINDLQAKNIAVHRANTRKVKNFIRSHGKLGKSDVIDANMLAQYAFERHASLSIYKKNPEKELLKWISRRSDLTQMLVQERNRLKAPDQDFLRGSIRAVIDALEQQIEWVDKQIKGIYEKDKLLKQKQAVLKTVPGIGDIVATQLLAFMPELGSVNRKEIASLGGVAPHPFESGKKIGHRFTRGGRADVKRILFIAGMAAARSHSELGQFYKRLIEAGKKKMVALVALMRKILVIANARLRDFYADINYIES